MIAIILMFVNNVEVYTVAWTQQALWRCHFGLWVETKQLLIWSKMSSTSTSTALKYCFYMNAWGIITWLYNIYKSTTVTGERYSIHNWNRTRKSEYILSVVLVLFFHHSFPPNLNHTEHSSFTSLHHPAAKHQHWQWIHSFFKN